MSMNLDPQLVREIARKHLAADAVTIDAAEIVAAARAHLGADASADNLHAWSQALRDELDGVTITVVMSWPDEQPQDERDADVRAVARFFKATGLRGNLRAMRELRAHFADRIAELDAHDTKAGEQR